MQWVMSQVDLAEKYPDLIGFLVNGPMKDAQDTEYHNRMQVRLLDKDAATSILSKALNLDDPFKVVNVRFEAFNWDAIVTTDCFNVAVELKPTISEDFPSVLRQVSNRIQMDGASNRRGMYSYVVVLADRINARSATTEQMVQMFLQSKIRLCEWGCPDFDDLTQSSVEPLAIGDHVCHAKFGVGVVVDTDGTGDSARAQVRFEQIGAKWLALNVARLEKLSFMG